MFGGASGRWECVWSGLGGGAGAVLGPTGLCIKNGLTRFSQRKTSLFPPMVTLVGGGGGPGGDSPPPPTVYGHSNTSLGGGWGGCWVLGEGSFRLNTGTAASVPSRPQALALWKARKRRTHIHPPLRSRAAEHKGATPPGMTPDPAVPHQGPPPKMRCSCQATSRHPPPPPHTTTPTRLVGRCLQQGPNPCPDVLRC